MGLKWWGLWRATTGASIVKAFSRAGASVVITCNTGLDAAKLVQQHCLQARPDAVVHVLPGVDLSAKVQELTFIQLQNNCETSVEPL